MNILWTNSLLSDVSGDLDDIAALGIDVLFSYLLTPATSDVAMQAYLDALDDAGLHAMLTVRELGKNVVMGREDKVLSGGELAAIDAYVDKWKTHPAVWGWYADDEGGIEYPIATRQQVYDTIKAAHPAGQVLEVHYAVVSGAYSPDVHDVFAIDLYPIEYDTFVGGSVDRTSGLVSSVASIDAEVGGMGAALTSLAATLDAAGETNYMCCMQAFHHSQQGTITRKAMPPSSGIWRMWGAVRDAGFDSYGAGFFIWYSDPDSTLPTEQLYGVGGTEWSEQRAEIAAICAVPDPYDIEAFGAYPLAPVYVDHDGPTAPRYSVVIGAAGTVPSRDITELVDLDTLHRSLSERGEASATIDVPVASENEVPCNFFARDATVAIDVNGEREWLGHVVAAHKPQPQDLSYTVDCAGGWDTLHYCAPYCKGFVETRYDAVTEYPASTLSAWNLSPSTVIDVSTDGEVLLTLPKGTKLKTGQTKLLYLWILGGLVGGFSIKRITCDVATSGSGVLHWAFQAMGPNPFNPVDLFVVASGSTISASTAVDTGSISVDGLTLLWFQLSSTGVDVAEQTSDQTFQVRNIRAYIDRTTAPRVDEIVAAIDAEVRPDAPTALTGAIGAPLTAFMLDPFMTPAEGIAVALTKAAVPPLCGIFQNQLVIKHRPTAPPDATRLWTVSEQLTPGLEWGVEVDEEQSVDYVGVAYNVVGSGNLIPAMTSNTAPSGVASASTILGAAYDAWKAFDRWNATDGQCWATNSVGSGWLQYQFPTAKTVTQYTLTTRNPSDTVVSPPKTWGVYGSHDGASWVQLDVQTDVTDWANSKNTKKTFPIANSMAYAYYRIDFVAGNNAGIILLGELEMMESSVLDGTPQIAYYPGPPPNAAARTALIDGGDLTLTEAMFYAQQGYHYLHDFASGPVTIPYVVRDANGAERPADVIRAWDWVQNVGSLDAATAGPFLVSEVEHQGHIATLTIGAAEAYAYNGPDRMPTKGRYVGAHRVRTRTKKRVSFAEYWKWKHRKDKRKPKMPRRHAKYGTIRGYKWTDVEGRYV